MNLRLSKKTRSDTFHVIRNPLINALSSGSGGNLAIFGIPCKPQMTKHHDSMSERQTFMLLCTLMS